MIISPIRFTVLCLCLMSNLYASTKDTTNLLINEPSLYLQQHATNPIHWHPWGNEALQKAEKENKPIFLSIGYSSCHWCHVMEQDSFVKKDIAEILNKNFIAIKVDRERRPDVDEIYMTAVVLMQGHGGWPLSVFLTPKARPFFGGTYYPHAKFKSILTQIAQLWLTKQEHLQQQAQKLSSAIKDRNTLSAKKSSLQKNIKKLATKSYLSRLDPKYGGFGNAPKFPNESSLLLLLNEATQTPNSNALTKVQHTLSTIAKAGIYDQVGGGFHRYATDRAWQIPHFEKMLYNQSNLTNVYLHAYALSPNPEYARIIKETLNYVQKDMQSPQGGFYTATDADSNGQEGEFFIWSKQEIEKSLSPELSKFAQQVFNITTTGNFEDKNILHLKQSLTKFAKQSQQSYADVTKQYEKLRQQLYIIREQRIHPALDQKIIASWNGMMIQTMAQAAMQFNNPNYLSSAIKAGNYLWASHQHPQGGLWRTTYHGKESIRALQDDYAYVASAYCLLYDLTNDSVWLQRAEDLTKFMIKNFTDKQSGLFYQRASNQAQDLIINPKSLDDSAIGSGNAQALLLFNRLYERTGKKQYQQEYHNLLAALSPLANNRPTAYASVLNNLNNNLTDQLNPSQYMAQGKVKLNFQPSYTNNTIIVKLDIAPGWHINAHIPKQKNLIGTNLASNPQTLLTQWQYPKAVEFTLPGFEKPLAVYEKQTTITASIQNDNLNKTLGIPLTIKLQACNQEYCLAPEERGLRLRL